MAKAKARVIMVWIKSMVSDHHYVAFRERLADKLEVVRFDPWIRALCIYKETKKIRSMRKE